MITMSKDSNPKSTIEEGSLSPITATAGLEPTEPPIKSIPIDEPDDKPIEQRRMDSISTLIEGKSVCGAVCFDHTAGILLFATNDMKKKDEPIVQRTMDYLHYVAKNDRIQPIYRSNQLS